MRKVAISLHTKDQAKSGEQEAAPKPFQKWEYTREGYLRFLVESKRVYEAFEEIIYTNDAYSLFRDTGLDRVASLEKDIAWISEEYNLPIPEISVTSPSTNYAKVLRDLSQHKTQAFVCHFYNFYLAHTAGGRMIGRKVADSVLFGDFDRLAFYKYESDVKALVADLKASINTVALEWTREEKDVSIEESMTCFKYAGTIMRTMFEEES